MATWTNTHPLIFDVIGPFEFSRIEYSAVVNKCIYTMREHRVNGVVRDALYAFDTETLTQSKNYCDVPPGYRFHNMATDEKKLYIFYQNAKDIKICEFHTKSSVMTEVFNFQCRHIAGRPQVSKNVVYILENQNRNGQGLSYVPDGNLSLIKIDLSSKKLESIKLKVEESNFTHELQLKNGKIYWMQYTTDIRVISLIKDNNEVVELKRDNITNDRRTVAFINTNWFNGSLLLSGRNQKILMDTFDFDSYAWYRAEVDGYNGFRDATQYHTAVQIANSIFLHILSYINGENRWSLMQLELNPTLTNQCMLVLANELALKMDKEKIKNVLKMLPGGLRSHLDNMIKTRRWARTGDKYEFYDEPRIFRH